MRERFNIDKHNPSEREFSYRVKQLDPLQPDLTARVAELQRQRSIRNEFILGMAETILSQPGVKEYLDRYYADPYHYFEKDLIEALGTFSIRDNVECRIIGDR